MIKFSKKSRNKIIGGREGGRATGRVGGKTKSERSVNQIERVNYIHVNTVETQWTQT